MFHKVINRCRSEVLLANVCYGSLAVIVTEAKGPAGTRRKAVVHVRKRKSPAAILRLKLAKPVIAVMKTRIVLQLFFVIFLTSHTASCDKNRQLEYTGVVTLQLLPAKVIKVNEIIEDPEPGTSYIGETGILLEVEENPEVMANWSVVTVKYLEFREPKTIRYEILAEQHEISVKYHAVSVEVTGDLSEYISE